MGRSKVGGHCNHAILIRSALFALKVNEFKRRDREPCRQMSEPPVFNSHPSFCLKSASVIDAWSGVQGEQLGRAVNWQPFAASQESAVQALPSSQGIAVPGLQVPD